MKCKFFFLFAVMVSFMATAEHWPTGYYRTVSDPNTYYYDDELRWYCHVQNQAQANLFDVDAQVRIVGDIYSFLGQAVSLNECAWPNGFYKAVLEDGTEGATYRLYSGNYCLITSPEMLAAYGGTDAVISTEANSDFGAHRTNVGQCFWPSDEE